MFKFKNTASYLDTILSKSDDYLRSTLTVNEYNDLINSVNKHGDTEQIIGQFTRQYHAIIKNKHQQQTPYNKELQSFIEKNNHQPKIIWGDCLNALKNMKSESVHLMVTSPPYYNARDYSQWDNLNSYLTAMEAIIKETYRVLDNHRAWVFNVGDITGNDNLTTKSSWGDRRIPLGAYFINIFEKQGFTFIDDFIWDKGEVQSQRHKNGNTPSPLYQYPMNCYEHIMIFFKHRQDETRYPYPVCGCLKVNGNAYSGAGIKSWECKNYDCFTRSKANRGKRFSARSILMDGLSHNIIDNQLIKKWRKDIVKLSPVIKINCKGENTIGHTAPFPKEIPEYAINAFSGKGEIVLDPFMGSGTTVIEATQLGRIGIGVELNKKMFGNAIKNNMAKNNYNKIDELAEEHDWALPKETSCQQITKDVLS